MADSWEDDDFEPVAPVVSKAEVVKGAWDDEEEEEEEAPSVDAEKKPAVAKPKKEKKPKAAVPKDETLADPVAEKLRQQRLVEESDFKATKELFGGDKDKEERSLEGFIPKTEADYIEYATLVAEKVTPFQKSFHYLSMLKQLTRAVSDPLKSSDVKELASALTVLANEKLKAEKAAEKGGAKKGKSKRELKVDAADDDFRNVGYDDPDNYDFM